MKKKSNERNKKKIKQAHTGAFFQPAGTGEKRCHHKGQCHKILFIQMTAFSEQEVWAVCDATLVGGRRLPSHGLCWVGKFHRPTDCTPVGQRRCLLLTRCTMEGCGEDLKKKTACPTSHPLDMCVCDCVCVHMCKRCHLPITRSSAMFHVLGFTWNCGRFGSFNLRETAP